MRGEPWRGVAIAESFDNDRLDTIGRIIRTETAVLEGEEGRGRFHFYHIEVSDEAVDRFIEYAAREIRPSWYVHIVRDGQMHVVFHNKYFKLAQNDSHAIALAKEYAVSSGIHPEQIVFERLFDNPYDE